MRETIKVYFNKKQVCFEGIKDKSFSQSPLKPYLYVNELNSRRDDIKTPIQMISEFSPFNKEDFYIAHLASYVDDFFAGVGACHSNDLPWSKGLAESVRWTNASLFHAIKSSIDNPKHICISPTSGFHHATPYGGGGFCTFSGQVISSFKLYKDKGAKGAYLDLDGHYGNSISDSKEYIKKKHGLNLDDIILININPTGTGEQYLVDLKDKLNHLEALTRSGHVDYIVWCHGADSHIDDDLGHQCDTSQWMRASKIFYEWLYAIEMDIGKCIPLTLSLFGGYRKDDYQSVINLHIIDLYIGLNVLLNKKLSMDTLQVTKKNKA